MHVIASFLKSEAAEDVALKMIEDQTRRSWNENQTISRRNSDF